MTYCLLFSGQHSLGCKELKSTHCVIRKIKSTCSYVRGMGGHFKDVSVFLSPRKGNGVQSNFNDLGTCQKPMFSCPSEATGFSVDCFWSQLALYFSLHTDHLLFFNLYLAKKSCQPFSKHGFLAIFSMMNFFSDLFQFKNPSQLWLEKESFSGQQVLWAWTANSNRRRWLTSLSELLPVPDT